MNDINQREVSKRIDILMKEFNIDTLSEFAEIIGTNKSNLYQAMKGSSNRLIGESLINKIALRLNINTEWILNGTGEMYMNSDKRNEELLLENHNKLIEAHIILVKNCEVLIQQNEKLFEENKILREQNERLMKLFENENI